MENKISKILEDTQNEFSVTMLLESHFSSEELKDYLKELIKNSNLPLKIKSINVR